MAENYDVGHYCKASSPDALKPAQEYFGKCVPVILEELSAADASQQGRKMSANYLKQLFEIREMTRRKTGFVQLGFSETAMSP